MHFYIKSILFMPSLSDLGIWAGNISIIKRIRSCSFISVFWKKLCRNGIIFYTFDKILKWNNLGLEISFIGSFKLLINFPKQLQILSNYFVLDKFVLCEKFACFIFQFMSRVIHCVPLWFFWSLYGSLWWSHRLLF